MIHGITAVRCKSRADRSKLRACIPGSTDWSLSEQFISIAITPRLGRPRCTLHRTLWRPSCRTHYRSVMRLVHPRFCAIETLFLLQRCCLWYGLIIYVFSLWSLHKIRVRQVDELLESNSSKSRFVRRVRRV